MATKWDWTTSAARQKAYAALTSQGKTADFTAAVWNELLDTISAQRIDWDSPAWDDRILNLASAKLTDTSKAMTAARFNSAAQNILFVKEWPWVTDLGRSQVRKGDQCKGQYFLWLVEKLNRWIEELTPLFIEADAKFQSDLNLALSLLQTLRVQYSGLIAQYTGTLTPSMLQSLPIRTNTLFQFTSSLAFSSLRSFPLHILLAPQTDFSATFEFLTSLPVRAPWFMRSHLTADFSMLITKRIIANLRVLSSLQADAGLMRVFSVKGTLAVVAEIDALVRVITVLRCFGTVTAVTTWSAELAALQAVGVAANAHFNHTSSVAVTGLAAQHAAGSINGTVSAEMWVREMYAEKIRGQLLSETALALSIGVHGPAPVAGNLQIASDFTAKLFAAQAQAMAAMLSVIAVMQGAAATPASLRAAGSLSCLAEIAAAMHTPQSVPLSASLVAALGSAAFVALPKTMPVQFGLMVLFSSVASVAALPAVPLAGSLAAQASIAAAAEALAAIALGGSLTGEFDGTANLHTGTAYHFSASVEADSTLTVGVVLLNAAAFKASMTAEFTASVIVSGQVERYVLASELDDRLASELDDLDAIDVEITTEYT